MALARRERVVIEDVEQEPAYAASLQAARQAGFATVESAKGDVEALAALVVDRLKAEDGTLFHAAGTVTAGNSSQTSDGAAAVVVMEAARARDLGLAPFARFVVFATAGVEPERFGIGPVPAVRNGRQSFVARHLGA